ncbi:MAG: class I SAM-dependent methyltransferase [Gammaproteobacteria bacterium]|nr:class I SAM-dependent methyltransferase [Gammaproteobacteria bacterium]
MTKVAICALANPQAAMAWAMRFDLPIIAPDAAYDWCLFFTDERVELRQSGDQTTLPVYVDFIGGRLGYRRAQGGGVRQPLARAMGIKGTARPHVLDCTAGLGRDAMVLANLGCTVTMIERSPIIAALLDDGLRRALANPSTLEFAARMSLYAGCEAIDIMRNLAPEHRPDVVYLDPMYPHREKSALVKKEMRAIRAVVGDDQDAAQTLTWALRVARTRVVVKRPKGAPYIGDAPPLAYIQSDSTRYDIFFGAQLTST